MKKKELELYIHIPFCVRKCRYCDFLSSPASKDIQDAYMRALCEELLVRSKECSVYQVTTIFIGGGTPSAVDAVWISRIMQILKENYDLSGLAEITMEINPGTVDRNSLQVYKDAGINRLSIGMQSTEDKELKILGRIHTYEQFLGAYHLAREAGFTNINVDIMSALPGQTYASYQGTLKRVAELVPPPEHISAYSLIVEEGTPFYDEYQDGRLLLPDEDTERKMYELTGAFLKQYGYERYEISNYALPGWQCRHNVGYWVRKNYLGFGIGAASLMENVRYHNTTEIDAYIQAPDKVREELQLLPCSEQMEETMFLGLRLTKGVSFTAFEKMFGMTLEQVYGDVIEKHKKEGLLQEYTKEQERYLSLTDKGLDVSNYVMADFLDPAIFGK